MAKRKPGKKVQLARVVKNAPAQTARHFPASRHKLSKSDVSPMMTVTVAPTINWTASESSANRLGPLLSNVLTQFGSGAAPAGMARMIMDMELKVEEPVLPLALSIPRLKAEN